MKKQFGSFIQFSLLFFLAILPLIEHTPAMAEPPGPEMDGNKSAFLQMADQFKNNPAFQPLSGDSDFSFKTEKHGDLEVSWSIAEHPRAKVYMVKVRNIGNKPICYAVRGGYYSLSGNDPKVLFDLTNDSWGNVDENAYSTWLVPGIFDLAYEAVAQTPVESEPRFVIYTWSINPQDKGSDRDCAYSGSRDSAKIAAFDINTADAGFNIVSFPNKY